MTGVAMKLSEKIRILRKARGMSQEEFGYSLSEATEGVTRQTVSDWENGKFEPKLDNIRDIARVLGVSFDVLLDESIDLNDVGVLKNILHNVPSDAKKNINTKIRYDIRQYKLGKKNIELSICITILALFVISIVLLSVGLLFQIVPLYLICAILCVVFFALTPISIVSIRSFVKDYKNPQDETIGEITNTHLIIYAQRTASNVVYLPLKKIKEIKVADDATERHGNVVISLIGREKPITLLNVAFPQGIISFYRKLLQTNDDPDPIQIL